MTYALGSERLRGRNAVVELSSLVGNGLGVDRHGCDDLGVGGEDWLFVKFAACWDDE